MNTSYHLNSHQHQNYMLMNLYNHKQKEHMIRHHLLHLGYIQTCSNKYNLLMYKTRHLHLQKSHNYQPNQKYILRIHKLHHL